MNYNLIREIECNLCTRLDVSAEICNVQSLYGSSGGRFYRFDFHDITYFIKIKNKNHNPFAFEREAEGLSHFKKLNEIDVPEVVDWGEAQNEQYIIMHYISSFRPKTDFWESFGHSLARLHRHTQDYFGYEKDNYIGNLLQSNHKHSDWISFFIEERIEPQLRMAKDGQLLDNYNLKAFQNLYKRLNEIFPVVSPSFVHGDLWKGNYLVNKYGAPCVIDPACYFGFHEMDLAMTCLFGGFPIRFYEAYQDEFSLVNGYQKRFDICNLYPLLVHLNLFGSSYLHEIESILTPFRE